MYHVKCTLVPFESDQSTVLCTVVAVSTLQNGAFVNYWDCNYRASRVFVWAKEKPLVEKKNRMKKDLAFSIGRICAVGHWENCGFGLL